MHAVSQKLLYVLLATAFCALGWAFTPGTTFNLILDPTEYALGNTSYTTSAKVTLVTGGLQTPPGSGLIEVVRTDAGNPGAICWSWTFDPTNPNNGDSCRGLGYIPGAPKSGFIPNARGTYKYKARFTRNKGDGTYETWYSNNEVSIHVYEAVIEDSEGEPLNTTQKTVIGKKVSLTSEIKPTIIGPIVQQWTVPEKAIKNYLIAGDGSSGILYELSGSDLDSYFVNFFWVNGGANKVVAYAARYDTANLGDSVMFNVQAPTITAHSTALGTVTCTVVNNVLTYRCGSMDPNEPPGVQISHNITNTTEYPGRVRYTQLIKRSVVGIEFGTDTNGEFWLDSAPAYGGQPHLNPNVTCNDFPLGDTPEITKELNIANPVLSIADSFRSYLMWNPDDTDGKGTIWVPLSSQVWDWYASSYTPDWLGNFSGGHRYPDHLWSSDYIDFPVWNHVMTPE